VEGDASGRHVLSKRENAPVEAWRFVLGMVGERLDEDLTFRVEMVVGELVDNALLHGEEPIEITVTTAERSFRIDVCDASPRLPRATTLHGVGMQLVANLSDGWGWERVGVGK
jgi:anti-sigma regulatory factor (Ser/Thr protein kinase)